MFRLRTIILLAAIGAAAALLAYHYTEDAGPQTPDRATFEKIIRENGGRDAYAEFGRMVASLSLNEQHSLAHIFGAALYASEGVQSVEVCDDEFLYGCFHAVLMAAIGDKGVESVGELKKVCETVRPDFKVQCEHGIGHGIVGTLGYETPQILEALALCDKFIPDSPAEAGCKGGVFMENAIRFMHDGTPRPRQFSAEKRWEPCTFVDDASKASCAFWQPMWWVSSVSSTTSGSPLGLNLLGQGCAEAPGGEESTRRCVAGVGNVAHLIIGRNTARSADVCAAAALNPRHRYDCHLFSARRFLYSIPKEEALRACDGLSKEETERCRTEAATAVVRAN